jgi:hypothetical protein
MRPFSYINLFSVLFAISVTASAQFPKPFLPHDHPSPTEVLPITIGGYSAHILSGGSGLVKSLPSNDPVFTPPIPWTLSAWIVISPQALHTYLIAGAGDPLAQDYRFFSLIDGKPALRLSPTQTLTASTPLTTPGPHLFTATFDGTTASLFIDGKPAQTANLQAGPIAPQLVLGPVDEACGTPVCPHFGGRIAQLTLTRTAETSATIARQALTPPDFRLIAFEEGSKPWAIQEVQYIGRTAPQDPSTLPQPQAPFSKPVAGPLPAARTTLVPSGDPEDWTLQGGWKLSPAPEVSATPSEIASAGFDTKQWLQATVPGTALTTMVNRGLYPDPDYGLNNLAIPENLNKQAYWYRAEFSTPDAAESQKYLVLDGINYQAEVWLNGTHLGSLKGAFTRGRFDVSKLLAPGKPNALAVLIAPVPHPGIPNEQSILLGSGLNGGIMELDGPTFMATEGWDWFPPMRDRDTGLWQDVHLVAAGPVTIADPEVITHLPLPDISQADITLNLPLRNSTDAPVEGTLTAAFEGVTVHKTVTVAPGETTVSFSPKEFPELHLAHPRLWWPNGYGRPDLYHLTATFATAGGAVSSEKRLQFGVREITYELSLLDAAGALRRVDYDPTIGRAAPEPQVDVTHAGMRKIPNGWASSIAAGDDQSPAFTPVADTRATPYLILKVNGVRIAVRGGSWGMDDSRKRIAREHLEPFFRYDRDANLNIIRNWQGQNTEEVFYDLADEYGMLVWNDFWEVTMDSNVEAEDPQLFLANARDTILRYRNHPSIAMWCGRNEGVPQPIINQGLIALTHQLDGTRYYSPSSNRVNLQPSGPYSYEDPADYYDKLDPGFAVEVGTPSLPTLEWFSRWIPAVDQWPISDDWAYHNWHPHDEFNRHLEAQFGAANNLADYERKAQLLNYVDYRAIFEGFNAHLWSPNAGRLLWMTQPAWPSMIWGILSSDYDTQASFYGTQKACEPVHIQLDLATNDVQIINTTRDTQHGLTMQVGVYSLAGKLLTQQRATLEVSADDTAKALNLDLAPLLATGQIVFIRLTLHAQDGSLLSTNFYWRAKDDASYRALNTLAPATLSLSATAQPSGANGNASAGATRHIRIHLKNTGTAVALNTKLTTFNAKDNKQILPAYYSDNYISLLPGEEETLTLDLPPTPEHDPIRIDLRGWNATKTSTTINP